VIAIIAILAAILFPVFAQAREKARQTSCLSNTKQVTLGYIMYMQDYDEQVVLNNPDAMWASPPVDASGFWFGRVQPYVKNWGVFGCPSDTRAVDVINGGDGTAWGSARIFQNGDPTKSRYFRESYGSNEYIGSPNGAGTGNACPNLWSMAGASYPASTVVFAECAGTIFNDWDSQGSPPLGGPGIGWDRIFHSNTGWGVWADDWASWDHWDRYARHTGGQTYGFLDGHAKYFANKQVIRQQQPANCQSGGNGAAGIGKEYPMINYAAEPGA